MAFHHLSIPALYRQGQASLEDSHLITETTGGQFIERPKYQSNTEHTGIGELSSPEVPSCGAPASSSVQFLLAREMGEDGILGTG